MASDEPDPLSSIIHALTHLFFKHYHVRLRPMDNTVEISSRMANFFAEPIARGNSLHIWK